MVEKHTQNSIIGVLQALTHTNTHTHTHTHIHKHTHTHTHKHTHTLTHTHTHTHTHKIVFTQKYTLTKMQPQKNIQK